MYKINTFSLFTAEAWKNDVEVIKYGDEIWINKKRLGIENIADRTEYYSSEFKKIRCEIQECGKFKMR